VTTGRCIGQKRQALTRHCITHLEGNAKQLLSAVRSHRSIEDSLPWVLDVTFDEDQCRVRASNAAQNLAILRQIAVNLLKQKTAKLGIHRPWVDRGPCSAPRMS